MKKQLISFFIALLLVFQIFIISFPVSATSLSNAQIITASEITTAGQVVYMPIHLASNPGLTYVKLKIFYDANAFTLFGVQNGDIISDLTRGNAYVWSALDTTTETGTFAILIFSVSETASVGTYPITISCIEASNHEEDVSMSIQNGSIIIQAKECIHDMETISYKEATCKETGFRKLECIKCDYSETITFDVVDCMSESEADCENDSECKYCGKVLESAYSHKYRMQVVDPTTTSVGYTLYTCMLCGESYTDDLIPPIHQHSYVLKVTSPTCTAQGYTTYTCSCGDSYKDNYTSALGHDYQNGICTRCEEKDPDYTVIDPAAPQIIIEKVVARSGNQIKVTVSLKNNPGIWGMDLVLQYDSSQLTLSSVANGTVFASSEWTAGDLSADKYILSYEADGFNNIVSDGVLAVLEFTVSENATVGSFADVSVAYEPGDIINIDFEDINVAVVSGGVEIIHFVYGDLNNDGLINKKDSLLLKMHLANHAVSIEEQAADVYADGIINKKDSLYLRQYLAGYNINLGK